MIGQTVYIFDAQFRVYAKDAHGHSTGGPIYREHWRPSKVLGETAQSWIIGPFNTKISKKELREGKLSGIKLSLEEVEKDCFVKENRHEIARTIDAIEDYDKLKTICNILGIS